MYFLVAFSKKYCEKGSLMASRKTYYSSWRSSISLEKQMDKKEKERFSYEKKASEKSDSDCLKSASNTKSVNYDEKHFYKILSNTWRSINQSLNVEEEVHSNNIMYLSKIYEDDLKVFKDETRPWSESKLICSVCGIHPDEPCDIFCKSDTLLNPIKERGVSGDKENEKLIIYNSIIESCDSTSIPVCKICSSSLKKKKVPRLSRYNIRLPDCNGNENTDVLSNLNIVEQLLISPILPMICLWRYRNFGQFASKGQCISFVNQVQNIASSLPRSLEEVVLNLDQVYGNSNFEISVKKLRIALKILKEKNKYFEKIEISDKNFKTLDLKYELLSKNQISEHNHSNRDESPEEVRSAKETLKNAGQNQVVCEESAARLLCSPLTIEQQEIGKLKTSVLDVFKSISNKEATLFSGVKSNEGWNLLFPTLLWNGEGGPDEPRLISISLKEWISYVLKIEYLDFKSNLLFICYSNCFLRKSRINGIVANKPLSQSVEKAIEDLINESKKEKPQEISEMALNALVKKISLFNVKLPGSLCDMREFRADIFSMMQKYGPPSIFLTLSAAENYWFETFHEIFCGKISKSQFENLSNSERGEIISKNPVKVTIAWKRRLKAFLNFVINGKSKPLGNVSHYVYKSEWQGRLSEHAHFLFWINPSPPLLVLNDFDGSVSDENIDLLIKAESLSSCFIPLNEISEDRSNKNNYKNDDNNIRKILSEDPILLHDFLTCANKKKKISDLINVCNIHTCGTYCIRNKASKCKSNFPFKIQSKSTISHTVDESGNDNYRILLRRNHERVNPFNLAIFNLWKANMDIQMLIGQAFASIIYVTYYTSKMDKASDIKDVMEKLKQLDPEISNVKALKKVLIGLDTCKATGAPEAVSNLLGYSHRFTSSTIFRIDTRCYLPPNVIEDNCKANLNHQFLELVENNENFNLNSKHKKSLSTSANSKKHEFKPEKIIQEYFDRPKEFFSSELHKTVNMDAMSMVEFIENYETTRKRKRTTEFKDSLNKNGQIVIQRNKKNNIILDLKYRISPPDIKNEKWCAGALALHVPHRSVKDLLQNESKDMTLVEAYAHYIDGMVISDNGSIPKYPKLHSHQKFEFDIHHVTQRKSTQKISEESKSNNENCEPDASKDNDEGVKSFQLDEDHHDEAMHTFMDIEPEMFSKLILHAKTNLKTKNNVIPWHGNFSPLLAKSDDMFLSTEELHESNDIPIEHFQDSDMSLIEHKKFIEQIVKGEKIISGNHYENEINNIMDKFQGSRKNASLYYFNSTVRECKSIAQKYALLLAASAIEWYFFEDFDDFNRNIKKSAQLGSHNLNLPNFNENNNPILSIIGVPGAGKSWIVSKLRYYCSLRLSKNCFPKKSEENIFLNNISPDTELTNSIKKSISIDEDGSFGRSAAICLSGAASGLIGGFTIHHALQIPVNLKREIRTGELAFSELSINKRQNLLKCWSGVKILIIDEVYTLPVDMISLIDERLRQIFESEKVFGGLFTIFVGDPRQIVPVNGKPLYSLSKYMFYDEQKEDWKKNEHGELVLTPREERGYKIYASSFYHAPLTTSVRISDQKFAELNMKIATYRIDDESLFQLNSFVRDSSELEKEPWINSPWMFPTWNQVNNHLQKVTIYNALKRGIFRAWSSIRIVDKKILSENIEKAKQAIAKFYTSECVVKANFEHPLPYIDFFIGQIICLKHNWNPLWGLYNNAKAIVVGIKSSSRERQRNPLMTIDEAIELSINNPDFLNYDLLVRPLMKFNGPSAIRDSPGIICIPRVSVTKKVNGISLNIEGPKVFPGNAFTHHQSQGGTFQRSVAVIDQKCKSYGMSNVVTSRTPRPENFALSGKVTKNMIQPCEETSSLVENEYNRLRKFSEI